MLKNKGMLIPICVGFFLTFLISCGGGGGAASSGSSSTTPITPANANEINVIGSFTGTNAKSNWLNRAYAWVIPKAHALTPNKVKKVLFFPVGGNTYTSASVNNGAFSINIKKNIPVGMIFVGDNNEYLGYLSLGNGIGTLPLNKIKDDITTINLQDLSSSGLVVEPNHNPIGSEIPLTNAEIKAFTQANGLFASFIKNPDIDGNGIVDILENKFFATQLAFSTEGGTFSQNNLQPTVNATFNITGWRYYLSMTEPGTPNYSSKPLFYGPSGSNLEQGQYSNEVPMLLNQGTGSYSVLFIGPYINSAFPPTGTYGVGYRDNKILSSIIPDQSKASEHMVGLIPSVTLNDSGTIGKISWSYKSGTMGDTVDPKAIGMSNIIIQISGAGTPCANILDTSNGRLYDSPSIQPTATEHILSCQTLLWSNVTNVLMTYDDLFGNKYQANWRK